MQGCFWELPSARNSRAFVGVFLEGQIDLFRYRVEGDLTMAMASTNVANTLNPNLALLLFNMNRLLSFFLLAELPLNQERPGVQLGRKPRRRTCTSQSAVEATRLEPEQGPIRRDHALSRKQNMRSFR